MKPCKFVFIFILCAVLLAGGYQPARAQQANGYYFSETGHNVIDDFWTFYQSVPDASVVFGLPITEQFVSADGSGLTVQYFQKVRFELYPDKPVGQRVQVTALGTKLYVPGTPSLNVTTAGACRVINGFGVCYDFLAFYDLHGGAARFGNPISAFEFQPDGRIVQYFERARFDWRPERPAGENVTLADYGRIYFDKTEDAVRLSPVPSLLINAPQTPVTVTSLRAMAFVSKAVTQPTDTQKIFVIVQNQAFSPVAGATGLVIVHLPDGQSLSYTVTTDDSGIAVVSSVSFSNQLPGSIVTVDVQILYNSLKANTVTSFRIWR